ncbi:hypothetical protein BSPWISOXPB_10612 [uncultured Gammaproteobacteria bacterium]|nr:hypothetical protein BSPWISOXPB_10612 [uncultured Gammaproteobacteria bacterium]
MSAAQNLTINANESITNGETIQNNEFLGQVTTNYQDNPAVAEAIATNGQFKINKPTQAQPYVIETRNEFVDITQFKASQYLFARPNIRFLDPAMSSPITLGDAYWEHQQLQKQISEQTKQTRLYADYDMNATFDRLFDQSNEEYEKLTDEGVEITFGVSLSKASRL